jgi:uncharacterized membrane protein
MIALIAGLVLFLGVHSTRVVAEDWRRDVIAHRGEGPWKGLYSLLSIAGFALLIWGYGQARQQPVVLWPSPTWTRHLASLLVLVSLVLFAAAFVPRNQIQSKLHHPMTLGVKLWAFAHLIANNTLADVLLFGSFLVWSVLVFRSARARDRATGKVYPPGTVGGTVGAVVAGVLVWAVFAFWAHEAWIGVRPLG